MRNHLIQIDARLSDGTIVPVRTASCNDPAACHLDGVQWDPAVSDLPVLSYDFFGGAFHSSIVAPQADFALITTSLVLSVQDLAALRFAGARVQIWSGDLGAPFHLYRLRFVGRIVAEPRIDAFIAQFSAAPDDAWLDKPLLTTYAGTGGLEGPEDLTGTIKPLVLGTCRFVPGEQIDAVDNVYQVSGYGAVSAITAAYDRLASLGPSSGNHATLAALLAASIANGSWATCLAQGLVRLGAPADGKVCFDVAGDAAGADGFVELPGALIARVAQLAGGTVNAANVAKLDRDRPWKQPRVLSQQLTARQVIQELADSVAAVAGISWLGEFFVQAYGFGEPSITLDASGTTLPLVAGVSQQPVDPPFWRLATHAAVTWQVHDLGEIASEYTLRGIYSAARVYRLDDMVSAADGRSFIYIHAVPSAGTALPTAPATSNSKWALANPATVGAPSGTNVGGLPADTVAGTINTDGTISTGNVVTDSVVDGSITTRGYAFTAGSVALSSGAYTWYDLQTVTVTVSAEGEPVHLLCELRWVITDNCRVKERLTRNGTVVTDSTTDDYGVNTSDNPRGGFNFVDDPGPGTYTYVYQAAANDAANASAKNRLLQVNGPKR